MGDFFHAIVDRDVSPAAAGEAAARVLDWLVSEAIILPDPHDNVVYNHETNGLGYLLGPNVEKAVAVDASELWETGQYKVRGDVAAGGVYPFGIDVAIGRVYLNYAPLGVLAATCPRCAALVAGYPFRHPSLAELAPPTEVWGGVPRWRPGPDGATAACPVCGAATTADEWPHDPLEGWGHLGFIFWNWVQLRPAFVAECARRLGHRTILAWGKL